MIRNPLTALWTSLHEPRAVAAFKVHIYATALAGSAGVVAMPTPHPLAGTDYTLIAMSAVLFGIAGVLGIPSAWTGKYWIERGAATAGLGGSLVFLFEVGTLLWPGGPDLVAPAMATVTSMFAVSLFGLLLVRAVQQPYAPGKGPELPERRAARLVVDMICPTRKR